MKIDTPQDLKLAKKWVKEFIKQLQEGGVWSIPRSNSEYRIWNKAKQFECLTNGEACVEIVLEALGYKALNGSTIEGEKL